MKTITYKDLKTMSLEVLMDKANDCAVDFHYYDGRVTQLVANFCKVLIISVLYSLQERG